MAPSSLLQETRHCHTTNYFRDVHLDLNHLSQRALNNSCFALFRRTDSHVLTVRSGVLCSITATAVIYTVAAIPTQHFVEYYPAYQKFLEEAGHKHCSADSRHTSKTIGVYATLASRHVSLTGRTAAFLSMSPWA